MQLNESTIPFEIIQNDDEIVLAIPPQEADPTKAMIAFEDNGLTINYGRGVSLDLAVIPEEMLKLLRSRHSLLIAEMDDEGLKRTYEADVIAGEALN